MERAEHGQRDPARPARHGATFEVRSLLPPYGPLESWPRAGDHEVRQALSAAHAAYEPWRSLPWGERVAILRRAADLLATRIGLEACLAPSLGLQAEELAPGLEEQLFRFRESLELLAEGAPPEGPGCFQAHWSDQLGGLGARLARHLATGETAVLISSPKLPQAARILADALAEAGLPDGVAALLHDDTSSTLSQLIAGAGIRWVRLRESAEGIAALRARSSRAFGAGLLRWSCWPVANSTYSVLRADDPAEAAEAVLERGCSRSSTLSGQLPGQVGRVVCHQRLFSRLGEELLTRLESRMALARPVPLIEPDLFAHAKALWGLGLDEGATPIFGSEPARNGRRPTRVPAPREAAPAGLAEVGERAGERFKEPPTLEPILFTNVDPGQRLATQRRPCPVLALIRAGSDEDAAELRARLDV